MISAKDQLSHVVDTMTEAEAEDVLVMLGLTDEADPLYLAAGQFDLGRFCADRGIGGRLDAGQARELQVFLGRYLQALLRG